MLPAIFLMGPTASGKSDLAIELAARLPCDIISVDSVMVYRGLDIGTAKPSLALRAQTPHRLIDIRAPCQPYSAAQFRTDALREMADITSRGRIPLLVGGTMLYFRALQHGLADMPSASSEVRAELAAEAHQVGWAGLHRRLAGIDPQAALRIHPNDPQRIQRALEVQVLSGSTATELYARANAQVFDCPVIKLVVAPADRTALRERIALRFKSMLDQGLLDEVAALQAAGDLSSELPARRAVGYRQVWDYLEGKENCEEMMKKAIIATCQLAKRQLTWLRKEPDAKWFDTLENQHTDTIFNYCLAQFSLAKTQ